MTNSWPSCGEIANQVATQKKSAVDVTEQALKLISDQDEQIGAFNHVAEERALAQAEQLDSKIQNGREPGPLAGVPIAVKDVFCTEGIPTTCSSKMLEGWIPPYTATSVERLIAAGAIIIGKTNCDEFAMGSSNENSAFGPVKNPLDLTRVPGGSSGGSAAAVAAGFVPASTGTDTGGSVRQPASLCGVVGLKPTYGAISRYGLVAFASSFDTVGVFANSVRDAALMFDQLAGSDPKDSTCLTERRPSITQALSQNVDVSGLRIGVIKELAGDTIEGFEPEVLERLSVAGVALSVVGAKVEEVSVPAITACLGAYYMLTPAEASSNLARYDGVRYGLRESGHNTAEMMRNSRTKGFGDEVKRRVMLGTYSLSAGYYDAYYSKAQKLRGLLIEELNNLYKDFDALICPTSPCVAFKFGAMDDPTSMYALDVCTIPSNMSGHPAVSVPFGTGAHGMPVGIQVLGPKLAEPTICSIASALEEADK